MKTIHRTLIIIILFGSLVRAINLNQPLLEGASTRQVQTAMIARNYYNHGFKLFYPQVDNFGDNPGYLMQEFYIIPFIAALLYKLLGGVHESILRLLSVFSYIIATIMIYKLARYYFNKKIGIISALCFTISPLSIYLGRAVHSEMAMIFFNLATIYSFSKWLYEDKAYYGLLSIISFIMTVALKVPNLYLLLPLAFISYIRYGPSFIKNFKWWFFFIASLIPIAMFNYFEYLVRIGYPNAAMENFKLEVILKYIRIYLTQKLYYKKVFEDLVTYTLTPVGVTLFLAALLTKLKDRKEVMFYVWISGVIIFFLLMPAQSIQGYYQIHFLPIACIFIAKIANIFFESEFYRGNFIGKKAFLSLSLFFIFIIVFRYSYAYFRIPENFRYVVEAGKAIEGLTEKDALVIASIENGPDLVYYSNRKGWPFMIDREAVREEEENLRQGVGLIYNPIKYLEHLRAHGADYFASASTREFMSHKEFSKYMFDNYRILLRTPNYIIFDLKARQPRT